MKILAHRGYWRTVEEKNTLAAIQRAFDNGYGIETDIRDYSGNLVVAHNIGDANCPLFEEVLRIYRQMNCDLFLALNVKADGIQELLEKLLEKYSVTNYFVFDMSIPEQVVYRTNGFRYFTRLSDYETEPVLLQDADGVWMDEWEKSWIDTDAVMRYLNMGKRVSIISPEIHGRERHLLWDKLKNIKSDNLFLCTDVPEEACSFFGFAEGNK